MTVPSPAPCAVNGLSGHSLQHQAQVDQSLVPEPKVLFFLHVQNGKTCDWSRNFKRIFAIDYFIHCTMEKLAIDRKNFKGIFAIDRKNSLYRKTVHKGHKLFDSSNLLRIFWPTMLCRNHYEVNTCLFYGIPWLILCWGWHGKVSFIRNFTFSSWVKSYIHWSWGYVIPEDERNVHILAPNPIV